MGNWLEDAEERMTQSEDTVSYEDRLLMKIESIKENYNRNKHIYQAFIEQLEMLVDRVNALPIEYRSEFGKLNFKSKDSRLGNHLYYITSSKRLKKRLYKGILTFLKKYHLKFVRVAYVTISSEKGMMEIELKQNVLLRYRVKPNGDKEKIGGRNNKLGQRKDHLFRFIIREMNEDIAREIIDWLAFKREMENISFFHVKHTVL